MSNEPKRPSVYDYSDLYQYSIEVNEYCDYIESEVERLKHELVTVTKGHEQNLKNRNEHLRQQLAQKIFERDALESEVKKCQSERLSADDIYEMVIWLDEYNYDSDVEEHSPEEWVKIITAWRKSKEGERNG